ncbi:hypothetical protein OC834_002060 [Tilletia horrida]|uniref:RlpA-like protein double-psi beta-barrel domain-containing protein n=1 Tax=Tilletia horrida TaxID=155126 RepID=A0AAN6GBR3_9BASI|nr:hypothetical protein OC842_003190 [Tilletia horrida]KAK0533935.1 hypothetical protein OC834_002060 [Tilletia horrida]
MRTTRVSSFTFAGLAVASVAVLGGAIEPIAAIEARQQAAAPAIVLTPPTPKPDIGIFRLPVTGMHTKPIPYTPQEGTTIIQHDHQHSRQHHQRQPSEGNGATEDSLQHAPDAGVRPMSPQAQAWQKQQQQDALSEHIVHDAYKPTAHPLRGAPSLRQAFAHPLAARSPRDESNDNDVSERRDSTGRIHIARMRDFAAKAEFRNRRRRESAAAAAAAASAAEAVARSTSHRQAAEFASIDVVSSPSSSMGDSAEADLASVNVGLGDGLDVSAIIAPGDGTTASEAQSASGSNSGSNSGSDDGNDDDNDNGGKSHSKSKGGKSKGKDANKSHHGSSTSSKSKAKDGAGNQLAKVTWYSGKHLLNPACGGPSPSDHALVAAVNRHSPFASCGDVLTLRSPHSPAHTVRVRIVDWCDTCSASEPWFDLTKGAFEKLADLEVGVLKGLEFERVREEDVKEKQRQMNHELSERRDGAHADEHEHRWRRAVHGVGAKMVKMVQRGGENELDDLRASLIAADFDSGSGSSGSGSGTSSIFNSVIGLLTGNTIPNAPSAPASSTHKHHDAGKPKPSTNGPTNEDDGSLLDLGLAGDDLGEDEDCDEEE